jgi:uncharacterized membrane protein
MTWTNDPLYVSGILCALVLSAFWLSKFNGWKTLGTPILVILMAALLSNLGLIPTATSGNPVYDGVFMYLAPLGIFIALLEVDLKSLKNAGFPILTMFGIGALGTIVGIFTSWYLVRPATEIGPLANAIAGMFTGTYIGGSINFNAVALHYKVNESTTLYAASTVVDNMIGIPWIVATLILPKYLQKLFPRRKLSSSIKKQCITKAVEGVSIYSLSALLGMGLLGIFISKQIHAVFPLIPEIIILTSIALVLAQIPKIKRLPGAHTIGYFLILVFLATIGTLSDVRLLAQSGELALTLFLFVGLAVLIHGLVIFGLGAALKMDWDVISVASQANVGGTTTAIAAAESLERPDLLIPGVLVGSLGNAVGTYSGFLVAGFI